MSRDNSIWEDLQAVGQQRLHYLQNWEPKYGYHTYLWAIAAANGCFVHVLTENQDWNLDFVGEESKKKGWEEGFASKNCKLKFFQVISKSDSLRSQMTLLIFCRFASSSSLLMFMFAPLSIPRKLMPF